MARSIAYCAVFPAIPALIVVAGAMLQSQEVQESVMALVEQYMPVAADAVAANIKQLLAMSGTIGLITLVGLIWSAPWQFSLVSRGMIPDVSAQDAFALLPAAWPSRSCTVRTKS